MSGEPLLDFLGLMQLGVIDDDRATREKRCGVRPIERVKQIKKKSGLFAIPHTMGDQPPVVMSTAPAKYRFSLGPGVSTSTCSPLGIH